MGVIDWLLNGQIPIGPGILWREVIGNLFGLGSALLGMRRLVWAWPIGIVGNVLLFTVFLGGVFMTPQDMNLYGQAGRQVMFLGLSVYGWITWNRSRAKDSALADFRPRWMTMRERLIALPLIALAFVIAYVVLSYLNSFGPAADAWILIGSAFAVYATARGFNEAWLGWIAVDAVGVPLLFVGGLYPSAILYSVYMIVAAFGFHTWWRLSKQLPTS